MDEVGDVGSKIQLLHYWWCMAKLQKQHSFFLGFRVYGIGIERYLMALVEVHLDMSAIHHLLNVLNSNNIMVHISPDLQKYYYWVK